MYIGRNLIMTNFQLFLEFIEGVKGPFVRNFYNDAMNLILDELDGDRVDLINNSLTHIDQQDKYGLMSSIDYSMSDMCVKYLGDMGIIVDEEHVKGDNVFTLYELLEATVQMYNTEVHSDITSHLNDDEQPLEIYLEMLNSFTDKDESFWCEWVDDVTDLFISKMEEYHVLDLESTEESDVGSAVQVSEELLNKVTEDSTLVAAVFEGDIKTEEQLDAYISEIEDLSSLEEQALHLIIGAEAVKSDSPLEMLTEKLQENYENFNKVIRVTNILKSHYGDK